FYSTKPSVDPWSGVEKPKQCDHDPASEPAVVEKRAEQLIREGRLEAAASVYRTLIQAGTTSAAVYLNLAAISGMQGQRDGLVELLKKALKFDPMLPEVHNNLGYLLQEQGDHTAAIACFEAALKLKHNFPEAHYNLAISLKEQADPRAAIASYNRALKLKPNYLEAQINLGIVLKQQGNLEEAIACWKRALEDWPHRHEAHNNLANGLLEQGALQAAISSYRKALQLRADCADTQTNLAMAELLSGDYKSGWKRYEHRFQARNDKGLLIAWPNRPRWDGARLPEGSNLVLVSEQGLGDTLQFMRYALVLRRQGIAVSLCAHPKLHSLIQASGIDPAPISPGEATEISAGVWMPLLSLPRFLDVSPDNPISTDPYISSSEDLIQHWQHKLAQERRPIIGINWQGNPEHEKTNSQGRSLPLEAFAPIANATNASFLSLQKGYGSEQLETCSFRDRFVSCQHEISATWGFLDTAAMILNCDLVITSDTVVAHLAGGLGKTTWLLLKNVPEWRWGLTGESSFWYPSMRLFRQQERNNWIQLMVEVAEELQSYIQGSAAIMSYPS
ncbi:MAG: tetratricopeptide repeat protein, partial [Cyanobacteriota bacterium]|nr:tetratricopeptide repeat protein [Cyanobacteriota bacterium]